jgi:hypothetical protein
VGHSARTSPYYFPELKSENVCVYLMGSWSEDGVSEICMLLSLWTVMVQNPHCSTHTFSQGTVWNSKNTKTRTLVWASKNQSDTRRDHDNALRGKLALARTQVWRAGPSESNTLLSCRRVQPANNPSMPRAESWSRPTTFTLYHFNSAPSVYYVCSKERAAALSRRKIILLHIPSCRGGVRIQFCDWSRLYQQRSMLLELQMKCVIYFTMQCAALCRVIGSALRPRIAAYTFSPCRTRNKLLCCVVANN